ncbi:hypothetical protein F53441_13246 [Fusarium austroafricanum]|uniref:Peptidase S33 tripeptidyl aminopeptidase-like C-terminal domain-containing protein n=1 Tax=Fusarium austroafricanum TaxID=2364996 RepID=A0A8H4NLL8_9HYPO|nr:hypothetical protein F53441_13246 [Fusarium austroafricanum]
MKFQAVLLSHLLLSAQASALPTDDRQPLSIRTNSKDSNSSKIDWSECNLDFGNDRVNKLQQNFTCARLSVPLDYTSAGDGETIKLDLIRAKATKEPFLGSVLYNPGGPGGSGVEAVLFQGRDFVEILGGQYDVIGFDPRGTGRTIPFTCSLSDAGNSTTPDKLRRREFNTVPQVNTWDYVKAQWDLTKSNANKCFKTQNKTGRFIGTPFVARDMISIVDALGQGPKLNYWGVSYGTILGQVTASMFPERIGRMMIDSNLDAIDYASTTWMTSMRDVERALAHLLDECVKSGKELCSLAEYSGKNTTGKSLFDEFRSTLEGFLDGSFTEGEIGKRNMTKIERELVVFQFKTHISAGVKFSKNYPSAVSKVEALFAGNVTGMTTGAQGGDSKTKWNTNLVESMNGISCGDSSFRVENKDDLFSNYQAHLTEGSWSENGPVNQLVCSQWKFSAAEQININKLRNVKTSFPLLVINGPYDPVTPLSGAWEVSARFRGSRVLVHEGVGHGFMNHPSNCTFEAVKNYFVDGEMPKLNTTCKPNAPVFERAAEQNDGSS